MRIIPQKQAFTKPLDPDFSQLQQTLQNMLIESQSQTSLVGEGTKIFENFKVHMRAQNNTEMANYQMHGSNKGTKLVRTR